MYIESSAAFKKSFNVDKITEFGPLSQISKCQLLNTTATNMLRSTSSTKIIRPDVSPFFSWLRVVVSYSPSVSSGDITLVSSPTFP